MRWINADEQLPPDGQLVLVRLEYALIGRVEVDRVTLGEWDHAYMRHPKEKITHWIPMPDADLDTIFIELTDRERRIVKYYLDYALWNQSDQKVDDVLIEKFE